MITHYWVTRAKCTCGYVWTTPGNTDALCKCGSTAIVSGVRVGGEEVTDAAEFAAAVSLDTGIAEDQLLIVQGEV